MLDFLTILLGASLLIAGRKLFWLLVGTIGFVVGVALATYYIPGSELTTVIAGLVLGVILAGIAIFLESTAILLTGFLGGGFVLVSIVGLLGIGKGGLVLIAFVAGGVVGLVLIAFFFEWALISISSLAGASMVVGGLRLFPVTAGLVFLGLLLAGITIQGVTLYRDQSPQPHRNK